MTLGSCTLRNYWKSSVSRKRAIQGPFRIKATWPALPASIDAAFQDVLTKKLFFFSGEDWDLPSLPGSPGPIETHSLVPWVSLTGGQAWLRLH